jgi:IS5 family transposase
MTQLTLANQPYLTKKKTTKREQFLKEMDQALPWKELLRIISKRYRRESDNGRPKMPAERMLRVYFLQQWFNLSDPGAEEALYDIVSMRMFAGIELGEDEVPDETTILNFRRFLEKNELPQKIFACINKILEEKGLLMKSGTIVDATIIHAPSSTKNVLKERDPEMKQTKKGNQWYFGMKAHIGTSVQGIVHSLTTTSANVHDSVEFEKLLHGEENKVYADSAYANASRKEQYEAKGVRWRVSRKAKPGRPLSERDKLWNRAQSRVRAFGEHPFHVLKCLWRHTKVRYRGLFKNTCQLFSLCALANVFRLRHKLAVA